jgi:hypothetical protein
MNIVETIQDPALLGASFKSLETWRPWLIVLKAMFNLRIEDPKDLEIFRGCK